MRFLTTQLLRYYDFAPGFMQGGVRRIVNLIFGLIYRLRFLNGSIRLPVRTYLVPVTEIKVISKRIENVDIFSKYFFHSVVLDGDWDLEFDPIVDVPLYEFSRKVFIEHLSMEKTEYYQQILKGQLEPYIRGEKHLRFRMQKHIDLCERIKRDGYAAQSEVKGGNRLDEVCISIGRDGSFILEDGRHRFMIALCLGLQSIPVIINRVHAEHWQKSAEQWDAKLIVT